MFEHLTHRAAAAAYQAETDGPLQLFEAGLEVREFCRGHDKPPQHPRLGVFAIARIVAQGLVEWQVGGRQEAGIVERVG